MNAFKMSPPLADGLHIVEEGIEIKAPHNKRPPEVLPVPGEDSPDEPAKKEKDGHIERTEENY